MKTTKVKNFAALKSNELADKIEEFICSCEQRIDIISLSCYSDAGQHFAILIYEF